MIDWLASAALRRPEHPFLVTPSATASFSELDERAATVTGALRSRGVGPGSVVALWAKNDTESVVAVFGAWRAGATVLLLNTRFTPSEVEAQVVEAGAHIMIGEDPPDVPGVPAFPVGSLRGAAVGGGGTIDAGRLALIVFTSGSSGRPKGVRITFANLEASAAGSAEHIGHTPEDLWLCNLPIFHIGGLSIVIRSAREASTVLLEPGFDAMRTAAFLQAGDVTLASLVSVTLAGTLDFHPGRYSGVKAVLVGGEPVPSDLVARGRKAGLPVLATYGMTETTSQIATARLGDGRVVAVPGAEVRAVDGRIEVRGPMLSPGYLGEPDRTPDEWFETGDLGLVSAEGVIEVLGRADDVIVTGGENVHSGEVEAVLMEHALVTGVVVVGVPHPTWGREVVAVYEGDAAPGELERHARYRLAGFKIPKRWVRVDALPRLSIGKIDRRAGASLASLPPGS